MKLSIFVQAFTVLSNIGKYHIYLKGFTKLKSLLNLALRLILSLSI